MKLHALLPLRRSGKWGGSMDGWTGVLVGFGEHLIAFLFSLFFSLGLSRSLSLGTGTTAEFMVMGGWIQIGWYGLDWTERWAKSPEFRWQDMTWMDDWAWAYFSISLPFASVALFPLPTFFSLYLLFF